MHYPVRERDKKKRQNLLVTNGNSKVDWKPFSVSTCRMEEINARMNICLTGSKNIVTRIGYSKASLMCADAVCNQDTGLVCAVE